MNTDIVELDRLQREHGLTYKEARVLLSELSGETNADLAEEFGVGLHAIYNLRRRALKKMGDAQIRRPDLGVAFFDDAPASDDLMPSRILEGIRDNCGRDPEREYAVGMLRLQELADLTFEEAQAYMCICGWEDKDDLSERLGITGDDLERMMGSAESKVRASERGGLRILSCFVQTISSFL